MHYFRSLSKKTIRSFALFLIVVFAPISSIQAAMIGTDAVLQSQQNQIERTDIIERLQAEDAQRLLATMGVDASEIKDRVSNMTTDELAQFNAQIDELPAGGIGIFGAVIFVLLLMIVLDLLGAVDFFPAIKTIHY